MSTCQPLPAATYANTGNLEEYGTSNQSGFFSTNTLEYGGPSNTDPRADVSPSQGVTPPGSFAVSFPSATATHDIGNFRPMLQDTAAGAGLQFSSHDTPHSPFHPTIHSTPFSQPRPQPHASHLPSFPLVGEVVSSMSCASSTPPQYSPPSTEYAAAHQEVFAGDSLASGLQLNTYHSNIAPTSSYHSTDYMNPTHLTTTHPHPSYTQSYTPHYPPIDNGRRGSDASILAPDTNDYSAPSGQDNGHLQSSERILALSLTHSSAMPGVNLVSSPESFVLPQSSSPAPHTPPSYRRPSLSEGHEILQVKTATTTDSPYLPGVGSAESVRRRLNILYNGQRQQSEQSDRNHMLRKELAKKTPSRRRKSNQRWVGSNE